MEQEQHHPKTYKELLEQLNSNRVKLEGVFDKTSKLFEEVFNIQQNLFYSNIGGIMDPYYGVQSTNKIVFQGYIKNLHLLLTSYDLKLQGNPGASLILLRQVLEFLLLAKYAIVTDDNDLANKWLCGKQVDIYKKVIKNFKKPDKKEFFDLWKILSNLTHATTSSYQVSFALKENINSMVDSSIIILILLRCNYHLLNSHLIDNRLKYRNRIYANPEECAKWRKEVKTNLSKIRNWCSYSGKQFIDDYECKWEFKR